MRSGPWPVLVPGLVLACLAGGPRTSTAQAGRAELTGEVRDEAGAVVPVCGDATVEAVGAGVGVAAGVGVTAALADGDADAGGPVVVNVTVPETGWPSVLTTR